MTKSRWMTSGDFRAMRDGDLAKTQSRPHRRVSHSPNSRDRSLFFAIFALSRGISEKLPDFASGLPWFSQLEI